MAKLSEASEMVKSSEVEIFHIAPTDPTFQGMILEPHRPTTNYEAGGGITFSIMTSGAENLKPGMTFLQYGVRYRHLGQPITDRHNPGPVNCSGYAHIAKLTTSINGRIITDNPMYPYTGYLNTLLCYGEDAKNSHVSNILYAKDTAGEMDDLGEKNKGLCTRREYFADGHVVWYYARLCSDIFNIDKLLPTKMKLDITIHISRPEFAILADQQKGPPAPDGSANDVITQADAARIAPNFTLEVLDPVLWVTKVKLAEDVLIGQLSNLELDHAKYWIARSVMRNHTIPAGVTDATFMNAFGGKLPKRIIYGLVRNDAFAGSYTYNPFNFQHFDVNHTCIYVNGQSVPAIPFTPNYDDNQRNWIREYYGLFDAMGMKASNTGVDIHRNDYPNGYCLYAYDISPNQSSSDSSHLYLIREGEVRIEFKFRKATPFALSCIIMAEFDSLMKIDFDRNVTIDWVGS